jgi:hypothetical protein
MNLARFALLSCLAVSCKEGPPKLEGGPSPTASAVASELAPEPSAAPKPGMSGELPGEKFPLGEQQIAKIVNPANATEYTGPTGVIEGTITVKGDPPAMKTFMTLPKECVASAASVYAPAYRAGSKNELADALVAVIGVQGYVRPSREDKLVTIKNCAIEPTVIDVSFGQRLMVANADTQPYMPQIPDKMVIRRLALKDMSPVPVFLTQTGAIGMSWLAGAMPGTDVPSVTIFVLPNALHQVTNLDGKYRITGVPVGKAKVTATHLGMNESLKDVVVEAGKVLKVDLVLDYKSPTAAPTPTPSSSVKPIH